MTVAGTRPLTAGDVMTAQQLGAPDGLVPNTSVKTLHRWARDGVIPAHKRVGKWFFIRHEVEAWIQSGDEAKAA